MDKFPALSNAVLLPSSSSGEAEGGRVPSPDSCHRYEFCSVVACVGRAVPSDFSVAVLGKVMAVMPLHSTLAKKRGFALPGTWKKI